MYIRNEKQNERGSMSEYEQRFNANILWILVKSVSFVGGSEMPGTSALENCAFKTYPFTLLF